MNSDAFKDRLVVVMEGSSKRGFAKKCSIADGTLLNYLSGSTSPDLKTLQVIAEVSGYNLAWLASGEGEPKRGTVSYPLSEGLKNSDVTGELDQGQAISQLKPDLTWLHGWIDEELQGKSMSEIMAVAVKIKGVLDDK